MKRPQTAAIPQKRTRTPAPSLRARRRAFFADEDGSLIIFSLFIFVLMLTISGMAVDIMRFETTRTKLQNTVDRAALAAAALNQTLSPEAVVDDYFLKAGMNNFLRTVTVTESIGSRRVEIDAEVNVPTHFFSMLGIENLGVSVEGTAQEAIGNVEISLVLDVSGSMGSNNRLINLKSATENFLDTVYSFASPGSVSTSIVPYAMQVVAGQKLLSHYNRGGTAHTYSYCLDFAAADFLTTELSTTTASTQTMHYDPSTSSSWSMGNSLPKPICPTSTSRNIMA